MGILRLLSPVWRSNRRPWPGRRRPTLLRAEELEPRTLLAVSLLDGVAEPTYIFSPGHAPGQLVGGPGGATPAYGPGGNSPAYQPNQSPAGYWPSQIRHVYNIDPTSLDGSGETIAIVDAFDDPNLASDLATFDSQFNLPAPPSFLQVSQTGGNHLNVPQDRSGGWEVEESLDVEWAHAIAPKANILLVEATSNSNTNLYAAVDYARNQPGVVAVSMSWGGGEGSGETSLDSHFTTPSGHPGITFLASSGDNGAPGGYPAMSPNVVAVGGTTLQLDANDNRISEVGWSGSGGGYSSVENEPAYQKTYAQSSYVQNTLGNTVLLNSKRGNPDVALVADPNPGVAMYDTFHEPGWFAVGGTSDAAPQWAGLIALVDQGRGAAGPLDGVTQTLPALYQLGASSTAYPSDFLDITSGSNGHSAQVGYDLVTGLGAPQARNLVTDLIGNTAPVSFSVTTSTGGPVAGAAFSVTVTALDASGHKATGYTGKVHFTTSDRGTGVVLPADYTFTSGDQGTHTFTNGVTLVTAGSQTLTATDAATSSLTGSATVTVSPAAATHFSVVAPSAATAGTAFTFTVTALDAFNNTATGYGGTVHFSSSDGKATLPANSTLTSGAGTFSATFKTAGPQTITAADTATSSITGTSNAVSVSAAAATHFGVSAPSSATAGSAFTFTVTALDQFNNTATGYGGTVHFTSSDGQAALPGNSTLTGGVGSFSATLKTAGSQTITATDTATSSIIGTSNVITVSPAAATHFSVSAPSSATAGVAFSFTVTALDAFNNTATGYGGTVHFSSSDGNATLPANSTLASGVGTFSATLKTAGLQTITAVDTATSSITGTSNAVSVSPAAATHFSVVAPSSVTAGTAFNFTVTALDAFGNTATGYAGTVKFSTIDNRGTLPGNYTFTTGSGGDNGSHTFSATFTLTVTETITATDTASSSIKGTSNSIQVNPGPVAKFNVGGPANPIAGAGYTYLVSAEDQFNNLVKTYTGTVHLASTDPLATLQGDYTFTAADNGSHNLAVTWRTVGQQTLTATDMANSGITGKVSGVTVNPATFLLTAPSSATAGTAFDFTMTVKDFFGNVATSYAGMVHFSSSDAQAVLPADYTFTSADAGAHTFSSGATLKTAGAQTLTATDAVTPQSTGSSNAVSVSPAAATHFSLVAPSPVTAGTAFNFTVTALDAFGNTATGYAGTVHFASSDSQAVLPGNSTLSGGAGTFSATLKTGGSRTLTATDTANSSVTGTSNTIQVNPGAVAKFGVFGSAGETAGVATGYDVVIAEDQFGNQVTTYTGTVHLTSSDPRAVLPADYTFTTGSGGDNGSHNLPVTFRTVGSQTVTATDTANGSVTGTRSVTVNPVTFTFSVPSGATAGAAFSFTVTVKNVANFTAAGYTGTVHFTGSDAQAVLPADYTFTTGAGGDNGSHTFSATLKTVGSQTITATDTVTPQSTGTSNAITVGPAAASHFAVSAPATATASIAFGFTVTALDPYGNTATGYAGTVHFASSDGAATLPADGTLSGGAGTFSATLRTVGTQTLTATDTAASSITGTSNAVQVNGGSAQFVKTDGGTQGYWQGHYGGDGFNVVGGGAPSYPSYAAVTPAGNFPYTWAASTPDPRALQKPLAPGDHVAAIWYAAGSFTVDVNFTDGATHQVALYLLDYDGNGRSEQIDVLDAATGGVLDTRTASAFSGGEYLVWALGGHVQFRLTRLSGNNAVLSGLFFGPAGAPPAAGGSAQFLKTDGGTQGGWQGHYGGDGFNVIDGGSPSYPSYAAVTPVGNSDYVWAASTPDPRGLQKPAAPGDHVAAAWYSAGNFTVDVNLSDGATHQVALYLLDYDGIGRSEQVDVLDAATGAVLDSRRVDSFSGGEYLVWTLGGHVALRLTNLGGNNAVLSGLFFGPGAPPSGGGSAQFLKTDSATQGYWQGHYGGDGYNVVGGGAPSYPSYAAVTPAGNFPYTWAASTPDPRALQKPLAPGDRVAAAWYSTGTFTVDVNITDGATHQVALYLLDYDGNGRSEQVDVLDAASGKVLDSRSADSFSGGEYLVWTLGGHVTLRLTRLAGNNAVLSGLFFGPAGAPPAGSGSAQFVQADAATQGTWRGHYGGDGFNVVGGGAPSYPSYAAVTPVGNSPYTWAASTADPRALQKPADPADRVAAAWYSAGSFSIDVNITDGATHQVALYLLDYDGNGRSEQIDVLDAATGKVLDTRTVGSFSGGEYLVWDFGGHVLVRLTRVAGNNAVLSGLFFDPPV